MNEVGERKTFGSEENEAVVLGADGSETPVPYGPKEALAETVWDLVASASTERCIRVALRPRTPAHWGVATLANSDGHWAECTCRRSQGSREARQVGRWPSPTDKLFPDDAGRSPRARPPMISQQPLQPQGALCPVVCSPRSP